MRFSFLLLCLPLAACSVGPAYHRPEIALSDHYADASPVGMEAARWWTGFKDPLLDRIVEHALAQNLDLSAAAARVEQARATVGIANAALLPTLDATGGVTSVSQSLRSPIGEVAKRSGLPRGYNQYDVGAQASWELDLFGRLSSEQKAARAELAGTVAEQQAVRLGIVAETVDAYLALRGLQNQLAAVERQITVERSLVDLIRQRYSQGVAAERDLHRAIGEQQGVEAAAAPLRAAIAGQINRLDVLMGRQAGTGRDELAAPGAVPLALLPGGSATPGDLLRKRPDIVVAEHRLIAANVRIGTTMAEYYPHVSLSGLLSVVSIGTSGLFTGEAIQASAGAGLRWRLFDFGRVDAEVARARGREAEALAAYRLSVLRATEDVEDAFVQLQEGRVEVATLERQVASLTRARDQAKAAYQGGAVALLDVLDADRAVLETSRRLEQARASTARASVAAVRALGGGYSEV